MSGVEFKIIPPTSFDLTKMSGAANDSLLIPVAQRIDLSRYEYGQFSVRVHSLNIAANNQLQIWVAGDGFTLDDPGINWAQYSTNTNQPFGGTIGSVVLDSTAIAPTLINVVFNQQSFAPGLAQIFVRGVRTAASTGSVVARISVDLVLRSSGPGGLRAGSYLGYGVRSVDA